MRRDSESPLAGNSEMIQVRCSFFFKLSRVKRDKVFRERVYY